MKSLLIVLAFVVAIVGFVALNYISYANLGVKAEAGIEAQYKDNQNILSNYTTKVMEAASITEMARDDLSKVMKDALSARYGADGSKAVFNWIKETYPGQVDPKLYQKIQQIVESGRNDFAQAQRVLLDKLRSYEEHRGYVWSGFWLNLAGYPKKDLSVFKIIVTDDVTNKFETGRDAPITLRPRSS